MTSGVVAESIDQRLLSQLLARKAIFSGYRKRKKPVSVYCVDTCMCVETTMFSPRLSQIFLTVDDDESERTASRRLMF